MTKREKHYELKNLNTTFIVLILVLIGAGLSGCESAVPGYTDQDRERLELVQDYAERVLERGKDQWSGKNSPLFADGINVATGDPVAWSYDGEDGMARFDGEEYFISNMINQQNLFRIFTGLSNLTGDKRFKDAARESFRYHFDHLAMNCGLLRWGGHDFVDLKTLEPIGHTHELKNHYPFYELMWDVDEEATARYIRAMWNAHILEWERLDMNRHGSWNLDMGDLWNSDFGYSEPFYEGRGLTFINAGADLMYAAGLLYRYNGEQGALDWAQRLHGMYVNARHPDTGLGVYQYSKPIRRDEPIIPMTNRFDTFSSYGDRAENQFGSHSEFAQLYGDVFGDIPREGWVMWGDRVKRIYVHSGFMQLGMAEAMGESGADFLHDTAEGLTALAELVYDPEENHFIPMWADGTDLMSVAEEIERIPFGYYCRQENCDPKSIWSPLEADMDFLMTYARAYRLTGDELFWETARQIARGIGLGEIGHRPGEGVAVNMNAAGSDYEEIFALLELYRALEHPDYLERARIVADRMIEERFHNGFFFEEGEAHNYVYFDRLEPLAILALDAVLRGEPEKVPEYIGGRSRGARWRP